MLILCVKIDDRFSTQVVLEMQALEIELGMKPCVYKQLSRSWEKTRINFGRK